MRTLAHVNESMGTKAKDEPVQTNHNTGISSLINTNMYTLTRAYTLTHRYVSVLSFA